MSFKNPPLIINPGNDSTVITTDQMAFTIKLSQKKKFPLSFKNIGNLFKLVKRILSLAGIYRAVVSKEANSLSA